MGLYDKSPYPLLTVNKLADQCKVSEHNETNDEKTACESSANDNESFFRMSTHVPTFQPQYEFAQNEIESINQQIASEEARCTHYHQPALSMKITNFEFVPTSNTYEI